jgi:poly(3-hydroxybutyrate) depolymerase
MSKKVPFVNARLSDRLGWLGGLALLLAAGCGGNNAASGTGTGGSAPSGSGGKTGSGGTTSSGGAQGTGGTVGSGGSVETGGAPGTGGATGSGGKTGTGGSTGAGGKTGSGGATSAGGAPGSGGSTGAGGSSGAGGATTRDGGPGREAGPAGGSGSGGSGSGGSTGSSPDGGGSAEVPSTGCGKTPTLKNGNITIDSGGSSRMYVLRLPSNYDNNHPYRLILSYHGANGHATDIASGGFFGLANLSNNSTIFIAPDGVNTQWAAPRDTTFTSDILKQVEADLCIDTTRIELEGFSMGAAMVWAIACNLKGTFRAAVGHSGGGVAAPTSCDPIAYLGSGGTQESGGSQAGQSDKFAKWDGCTVTTFPNPPAGGHVCSDYTGCSAGHPVRWCLFDAGHMPDPKDSGKSSSWMPSEVWTFLSQF